MNTMDNLRAVFVINVGAYDDCHVESVWTDVEAAHKAFDDIKAKDPDYGTTYPIYLTRWPLNGAGESVPVRRWDDGDDEAWGHPGEPMTLENRWDWVNHE